VLPINELITLTKLKMKKLFKVLKVSAEVALFAMSMAAFAPANASVIVDHSNGGRVDGTTWTNMGGGDWTVWDDFTLTSGATINAITYYSYYVGQVNAPFTLQIGTAAGLSDVFSATIANSAVTQTTGTGSVFDASFAPVKLNAGTYWLTFNSPHNLYGSAFAPGGNLVQMGYGYAETRFNNASVFSLSGTTNDVPEPGSLALLSIGLGLGALTLRRRKS
jgi:hypothetical protein